MRNFELEVYLAQWEFRARYHMTASDIESMSIAQLLEMASVEQKATLDDLWLGYTETLGSPALREEIAHTYDEINAKDILCFAGAEEGLYTAMKVLLDKEDHAIVVVPNYQASETIPMESCEVTGVALRPEDGWQLDIDEIRNSLRPNTKLISINFPHNPTGVILERNRLDDLVNLCRERGLYLFSDEVYRLIERDSSLRLPQVADIYEKGLSLNVMSKAYGLPGLRIGWIATKDHKLLERMERYKHYLSICNSAPSEFLATIALKARDRILERNRALVDHNAQLLDAFFTEFSELFSWKRPDGGCVGYPLYKGLEGADAFCEDLLKNSGVLLLPPKVYRSPLAESPIDRFRIGFGRKNMEEGLEVFRRYLHGDRG
ncbi:aminotransferase class I/II-fold pyridoxal phosphate-dependent enzyme [Pleomorphochaeta sp. DL1XJH-081]|uniref:aminotransferase class I/II-fold pyridoxal phosphate-dependent enzyme n=1 Tax=Pleomorphochaeta sp. DL1XJH-081 TaxID=3409690 RepID=UPI003BB4C877